MLGSAVRPHRRQVVANVSSTWLSAMWLQDRANTATLRPKWWISSSDSSDYDNFYRFDQRKHICLSENAASHAEGFWLDPSRDHPLRPARTRCGHSVVSSFCPVLVQ